MYRNILVAYNGTKKCRSALHECIRLAPGPSAEIHLLLVTEPDDPILVGDHAECAMPSSEDILAAERAKSNALSDAHALLSNAGMNVTSHVEAGEPVCVIAELALKLGIDLVIVGQSHHKPRWWRSTTNASLMERVHCSVLVATDALLPPTSMRASQAHAQRLDGARATFLL